MCAASSLHLGDFGLAVLRYQWVRPLLLAFAQSPFTRVPPAVPQLGPAPVSDSTGIRSSRSPTGDGAYHMTDDF